MFVRERSKLPKEVQDEIEEDELLMRLWSGLADNGLWFSACLYVRVRVCGDARDDPSMKLRERERA